MRVTFQLSGFYCTGMPDVGSILLFMEVLHDLMYPPYERASFEALLLSSLVRIPETRVLI